MLALKKTALSPGLQLMTDAQYPNRTSDEVIVRVTHVGICGSDIHAFKVDADYSFMQPYLPVTMGHEFSGVVEESDIEHFPQGTRVCVIPSIGCKRCQSCRDGNERDCNNGRFIGYTKDGGFSEYVAVPAENLVAIPANVDNRLAALAEPLTISAEAILVGGITLGDTILIVGAGTIGQAAALFARQAGASSVVVVGYDDAPRFQTLRHLGFNYLINVATESLEERLQQMGIDSFDCVIEASGASNGFKSALPFIKKGGRIVLCGIYSNSTSVDLTDLVRRRVSILSTYRSQNSTWLRVLKSLASTPDVYSPLISHDMKLTDYQAAFELAITKQASKILLTP